MPRSKKDDFAVVAIISAFNEADIISPVIGHLVENGVNVYLIDNHSTDGTSEQARPWLRKGLIGIEEFPAGRPEREGPPPFDWEAILRRKEQLAKELPADWFIHHDADEFREAPWPGMKLSDAIRWVDGLGYNCIDFRVLNFPPLDDGWRPGADPRKQFTSWEEPNIHDAVQLKCWKNTGAPVSLAASGGHEARFRGRSVFPIQFLLRHYPIRSQEHGRRKVFEERKNRFLEKERAKGWHVQYDSIEDETHSFLGDPQSLHPYDEDDIRFELILNNRTAREKEELTRALQSSLETRDRELSTVRSRKDELERHNANLQAVRAELERHTGNLEGGRQELERHALALEQEHARLTLLVGNLESGRGELERHARNLEREREKLREEQDGLRSEIASLQSDRAERERHVANLEGARTEIERYVESLRSSLSQRERDVAAIESNRAESERYAKSLEQVRSELEQRTARAEGRSEELERSGKLQARLAEESRSMAELLEARVRELSETAKDLESRLATALASVRDLDSSCSNLERRNRLLIEELEAIRNSTTWRWSAPLRRLVDVLRGADRS